MMAILFAIFLGFYWLVKKIWNHWGCVTIPCVQKNNSTTRIDPEAQQAGSGSRQPAVELQTVQYVQPPPKYVAVEQQPVAQHGRSHTRSRSRSRRNRNNRQ